jgi:uncharacterized 2Fe-2S/4Fe-4S cluster protein (DUF4445 family)
VDKDTTAESVSFKLDELETNAHPGDCLFNLAQNLGIPLPSSCYQSGKCRECLIQVLEGESLLTRPSAEEKGMSHGYRLACRSRIRAASGRIRCRTLRRSPIRIEEEGQSYIRLLQQNWLSSFPLQLENQLQLHRERLQDAVSHYYGLAIDIGTTTVVVRLMDLESGRIAASHSFENPQRFGGSDVMARIRFSDDDPTQSLKRVLVGYINNSIRSFPVEPRKIVDVVVAGNTTMRDLFFGLDVSCLGQLPFRSTLEKEWLNRKRVSTSITVSPSRIGLRVHPEARVYGLPLIGSHVGADTAACLLVTDYLQSDETALLSARGSSRHTVEEWLLILQTMAGEQERWQGRPR